MRRLFAAVVVVIAACAAEPPPASTQRGLGSCGSDDDCDDGKWCTRDDCRGLIPQCFFDPIDDPQCCETVADCDAPPTCQAASCDFNGQGYKSCVYQGAGGAGCCSAPGDCQARACHSIACTSNVCTYTATPASPGCCATVGDCPAGNACQERSCDDNTCGFKPKILTGCCDDPSDCGANDGCHVFGCVDNVCTTANLCDAGVPDAPPPPPDAMVFDAALPDAALPDAPSAPDAPPPVFDAASPPDAPPSPPDATELDAALPDAPLPPDAMPPPDAMEEPEPDAPPTAEIDAATPELDAPVADAPVPDADVEVMRLRGGGGCALGGRSSGGQALVLVALVLLARRRRGAMVLALMLLASAARAQDLDGQLFRPPATSGGVGALDGVTTPPHLAVAAALYLTMTRDPLVLHGADDSAAVVDSQLDAQAALSVGLFRRLEVGIVLPVLLTQDGEGMDILSRGLGDLRLEAKVRVAESAGVGVALAAGVGLPTGDSDGFYSDRGVTFRPRAMVGYVRRRGELLLQLGAVLGPERQAVDLSVGQQLTYGLGARVAVAGGLAFFGSVTGLYTFDGAEGTSPVEWLVGPELRLRDAPLEVSLGAGRGLNDGYGAPALRVVLAARWAPRAAAAARPVKVIDRDGDGIVDSRDQCPDQAGPWHLFGCPEPDGDGDKIVDSRDRCPQAQGPAENAGCPDTDGDSDGVIDRLDRCPRTPGLLSEQGCPPPDRDHDGVADVDDKCPEVVGVRESNGCPDIDTDGDGIPDRLDACPTAREVWNGEADDDGCPDKGRELAVVTDSAIVIRQQIFFEENQAAIQPRSFLLLATVANLLQAHPEIKLLRVEGHTDDRGARAKNLELSQQRAEAVRARLVDVHGIAPERLIAQGFGPDRPIASNKTTAGRAKNRRSELVIVEQRELK